MQPWAYDRNSGEARDHASHARHNQTISKIRRVYDTSLFARVIFIGYAYCKEDDQLYYFMQETLDFD